MKVFNAFQLVCLFAGTPFLISYLYKAEFTGSVTLFYVVCLVYCIMFCLAIASVATNLENV